MMTDPIADMLTRIRNAQAAKKRSVLIPYSRMKKEIARILEEEGYVGGVSIETEGIKSALVVDLKYQGHAPRITTIKRISTPGQRVYRSYKNMPKVLNDLGIAVISTPKGLMTNKKAQQEQVGGEVLCEVY
ncbi:MAG: 30S ribosomal protein S8 [Candidatus Jacksonbacteria bacterium RIFCSPLOWO2_02_FULL_43_9]|nr:MAG: 30S ribosomal protein S8 [Parcubacteria group bacterium GW2011_GWA2_43_13]OGY69177.1 MAG: 30S ribosomal protein S8 [Candidatus Jacksonbacteria bacterium RIFCSPHIGHO2_02_FULL_43_10]OGY70492.1 MAG: 30S ribosomal protein S8 [Candidatus Jacksonbacteria bacterium RIFCSPLOWO2_01_FULL_44_13]OGY72816.1 MAG: 30S ribosomal protein S8 [Candidatus Jacksonbacteria bacterium RIFCSPLOWO2_02_FULL_43_9]HAZ16398.1 30S ribosomal protein S8 [Candidatus Jacksonbacteria bacterium]